MKHLLLAVGAGLGLIVGLVPGWFVAWFVAGLDTALPSLPIAFLLGTVIGAERAMTYREILITVSQMIHWLGIILICVVYGGSKGREIGDRREARRQI